MVGYQYSYLIGALLALLVWIIFFLIRKDTRKEMLILSLIFGVISFPAQYVYIQDWWKPLTIIGTSLGIEDFIFGFSVGGVLAVAYSIFFKKRIKIKKVKIKEQKRNLNFLFLFVLLVGIFSLSFFVLKLNTLISTILAFVIPTIAIYIKRKDLIKDSIMSGIVTIPAVFILYQILYLITPGFFGDFWLYQNIGRILIFRIPLEEFIWFFFAGAFIGPLYEYWKEGKLINIKN